MRVSELADWLEWQDWADPILQRPYAVEQGQLLIPDVPGVGIDWNEDAVAAFRADLKPRQLQAPGGQDLAGAGLYPIAFRRFQSGDAVVDNKQMTVLRDPFSAKPFAPFYAHSLVDGGVLDFDAIKICRRRQHAIAWR